MSAQSHPITTAAELLSAPGDLGPCELVRGELIMMSPGKPRHGVICSEILRLLSNFAKQNRLGMVFKSSTGYCLAHDPDTVRAPDVSFVKAERMDTLDLDAFFEGAPDLAVEVLSPSNTAAEMREKMDDYFAAGCRVVWIVDPMRKSITVYRSDGVAAILTENDTLTEEELLPGFSLRVGDVFPAK